MTPVVRVVSAAKLPPLQIGQDESGHINITGDNANPSIASAYNQTPAYTLRQDSGGNSFLDFAQGLYIRKYSDLTTFFAFDQGGHFLIHDTAGGLAPVSGQSAIWGYQGEIYVMDDSGNVTNISPHSFEGVTLHPDDPAPIVANHWNEYTGVHQKIYLSRLAQLVENLTGEQLIFNMPQRQARDWTADETTAQQQRADEISEYDASRAVIDQYPDGKRQQALDRLGPRPVPYIIRPIPEWIASRMQDR